MTSRAIHVVILSALALQFATVFPIFHIDFTIIEVKATALNLRDHTAERLSTSQIIKRADTPPDPEPEPDPFP